MSRSTLEHSSTSDDVRREERRLGRLFRRAVWIAAALPAAAIPVACGDETIPGSGGAGHTTASSSSAGGSGGSGAGGAMTDAGPDVVDAAPDTACDPVDFVPDPPDPCGDYVRWPCGLPPNVQETIDCFLRLVDCEWVCPGLSYSCHAVGASCVDGGIVPGPNGEVEIDCATCIGGVGRVPAGLSRARIARGTSPLGDWLSVTSHLEAASVHAFRRLHRELTAHRAPTRLLRATRRAQRDEVRHARLTAGMARRFGGAPPKPSVADVPVRALDVVAIENAVEGCVKETFGALVATFQAAKAGDPAIARMMGGIAEDETRHAALSWAIAAWASRRLAADDRARLAERCRDAVAELRREEGARGALATEAGLPDAAQRAALIGVLEERLWSRGLLRQGTSPSTTDV